VTLEGSDLARLEVSQPASSVRVLIPDPIRPGELEIPGWNGNRFVRRDGSRPILRTLTPRFHAPKHGLLHVDVVVHGDGAASRWASAAECGTPAAVSGPARGYGIDPATRMMVLGGDETAIAALAQIIEALSAEVDVVAHIETATEHDRPALPAHPRLRIHWLVAASGPSQAIAEQVGDSQLPAGFRLWAAGEAAAMQRLRRRLFQDRGISRNLVTIRGYWKHGRSSEEEPEAT
jgi:NADPH-dependent ferric siderophore reductase